MADKDEIWQPLINNINNASTVLHTVPINLQYTRIYIKFGGFSNWVQYVTVPYYLMNMVIYIKF